MKSDFIIALTQLAAERNLPREIVLNAIESALVSAYKKDAIVAGQDIQVKLDPGSGEVHVFIVKTVVDEVTEPVSQISVADARKVKKDAVAGDVIQTGTIPHSAGRIAAQTAKQVVIQRLREAERDLVFQEYADKEGEVFTVTVQRVEPKQVIVELGRAEAVMPTSEQVSTDRYKVGQKFKVLLQSVRQSNKGPEIVISRAEKLLIKRLFEMEVPEIYNGAVEIVAIAREAGSRSKVAVWAKQEGVDAVGSCVGLRGIRIQNIVNELHGEKIDVVQWNKDPGKFIASALSPAVVLRVDVNRDAGTAMAVVPERQLSLAIGKEGQNARLAAKLTGLKIDIKSDVEAASIAPPPAPVVEKPAQAEKPKVAVQEPAARKKTPVVAAPEPVVAEEPVELEPVTEPAEVEEVEAVEEPAAVEVQEPEPIEELVPIPSLDRATSLRDVSDDIWRVRGMPSGEPGMIRFAEDIDELRFRGAGSKKKKGGGGRDDSAARKTKAGKKR